MIEPQSELIQYPVRFLGSCESRQGDETRRSPRRFTSFATARSLQRRDCGCSTAGCSWSIQEIQKGRWKRRVPFHKSQRVDGVGLKQGKKTRQGIQKQDLFQQIRSMGKFVSFLDHGLVGARHGEIGWPLWQSTWGCGPHLVNGLYPQLYIYIFIWNIPIILYIYTEYMSSYIYTH